MLGKIRHGGMLVLALAMGLVGPARSWAKCDTLADQDQVRAVRNLIKTLCDCDSALTLGAYGRCVRRIAFEEVAAGRLPLQCKNVVVRCGMRSVCGRRSAESVTCVKINHLGQRSCRVVGLPSLCQGGVGRVACVTAEESCCDALELGCLPPSTSSSSTTSTTSTTIP